MKSTSSITTDHPSSRHNINELFVVIGTI